ncbi:MAG: peptidase M49 [Porphyromonadaceae bacterium]|nr:peptidase M49 [Porphyromonadaceae bacterium]
MTKSIISGSSVCRFADIEILRYEIDGFEALSPSQRLLVYHLSEAALCGRDIIFDQNGRYGLRLRRLFEGIYQHYRGDRTVSQWAAVEVYLYRLWFSSGIHHHYGNEKFEPAFDKDYLQQCVWQVQQDCAELLEFDPRELEQLCHVIFDPTVEPKRTEQAGSSDLVAASSVNFYAQGLGQAEAEAFYALQATSAREAERKAPPSCGLNSRLMKGADGKLYEQVYRIGGLYGEALAQIIQHLKAALAYVESQGQRLALLALIEYYKTGDLEQYNAFCLHWVQDTSSTVDFVNGFTEVYADPLGLKGSWEGLVHIKDHRASERTRIICQHAGWFEEHAPIDDRFKKPNPKGMSASVVHVAMLSGDSYPATPIGINLPNADWIRADYGSKSVTIGNIHEAYRRASASNGMDEAFVPNLEVRALLNRYDGLTDELHTDLHECLGHGSGQLLPGVSPDALGPHGSTMEETRADLFALYYMADEKLVELGLLPDMDAYKACYYRYLLNGLVTQLVRIRPGHKIEEAHMRNRALIARYVLAEGEGCIELQGVELIIHDYQGVRTAIARLLAEVQRIKSVGDPEAAERLIGRYAIDVDPELHREVLERYARLNIAPYRGFVNPHLELHHDDEGNMQVVVSYEEGYAEQMLRYSRDYSFLPLDPVRSEELREPHPSADTLEQAKELRTKLRGAMDGIVSSTMRSMGLHYGINFGLTLEYVQRLAKQYPQRAELAEYLLSRDVRELKLIGQLIYPADELSFTTATHLASHSFSNPELRDCLVKHLFDRSPYAPHWAMAWLRGGVVWQDLASTALTTLARHFTIGELRLGPAGRRFLWGRITEILSEELEYITPAYTASILCLKRWARVDVQLREELLMGAWLADLRKSPNPLLREAGQDLYFDLTF